jgi:hypothetical protein
MVDATRRGRLLGLVALVALVAGSGSALALSLSGSKPGPETGTLTGEISLYYGGPKVITVSQGHGTVVIEGGDRTVATQGVTRGHRFRFVLAQGFYQVHAELSSVRGESVCPPVAVLVRVGETNSVKVRCSNAAG